MRLSGIYAIVDIARVRDPERFVASLLAGGVALVQYRAKDGVARETVRRLAAQTRGRALLIVNDDLDAALDAGGLHVGQEDLAALAARGVAPAELRARLGARILGISVASPAEARSAEALGADYLGVGPYNATASKHDAGPAIGAEGVRAVAGATSLPVAAVGGIGLADVPAVRAAGARMAAVISALDGDTPEAAARALVTAWECA